MWEIITGDCIKVLKDFKDESIDAVITDPPYGIGFMNEKWDKFSRESYGEFSRAWGHEIWRVLKPGAHALVFG